MHARNVWIVALTIALTLASVFQTSAQSKFCYEVDFRQGMGFFTHAIAGQSQNSTGIVPAPGNGGRIAVTWNGPEGLSIDQLIIRFANGVPSDGNTNAATWNGYESQPLLFSGVSTAGIDYSPDPLVNIGGVLTFVRATGDVNTPSLPSLTHLRVTGKGSNAANNCGVIDEAQTQLLFPFLPSPTPLASSTPRATIDPDMSGLMGVYNQLATAAANVNALPSDIAAPNGQPLLTNDDGRQLFAYAKWVMSPNILQELAGEDLSKLFEAAVRWVTIIISIIAIYFLLKLIVWLIEFAIRNWLWGRLFSFVGWIFRR
jgi:hypothetical protein